jgi:hypothetical protein
MHSPLPLPKDGRLMSQAVVERATGVVGRPVATLVVSTDPDERPFVAEGLLLGATIFLLQRYAGEFLKGAGFDEAARRHGERARAFLRRLREREPTPDELAAERQEAEAMIEEVRSCGLDEAAQGGAEQAVVAEVLEAGATSDQARDVAAGLSALVLRFE